MANVLSDINCSILIMSVISVLFSIQNQRDIYAHNDMDELPRCLDIVGDNIDLVAVIFDGIFSMRGDDVPIDAILAITEQYNCNFRDGVITVVKDWV